jgi:NitT/TauT family transport system substrate-binding protein
MDSMVRSRAHASDRRRFLARGSTIGAAALGLPRPAAAEPPPEIRKIRLVHAPAICLSPQYLAEELLRAEGFAEVEYVELATNTVGGAIAGGLADLSMDATTELIPLIDAGERVVVLAGVHAGCYELFGNARVKAVRDLKGKTVAITAEGSPEHVYLSSIVAYVGMNPLKDIVWVNAKSAAEAMQLFVDGKADAFLAFAPQPQELRARKIGRVILNTTLDRPWSQYFCCSVAANRDFVRRNPVATKRALRAILKAADICTEDPQRAARLLQAKGYEPRYEIGLEVLKSLPYRRWREANPEDTIRFHALRLHEVGMIKNTPQKLIAQGTDWRFLNELKKELKA